VGQKILLVKDDTILCDMIREYLTDQGYHVVSCGTAEEALKNYVVGQYDAIVTDYHLPGLSGIDFIKEIRKLDQKIGIVVSSLEMKELIENQSDGLSIWEIVTDFSELSVLKKSVVEACEYSDISPETHEQIADAFASEIVHWKRMARAMNSLS
jgi:CheY-like chemotaxis protein